MIRIKLALIEDDKAYADRLIFALNTKYQNELEVYLYRSREDACEYMENANIDVVLAERHLDVSRQDIPNRCSFAYLCDSNSIDKINGEKTVGKYQKIDTFYKDVLGLYSEIDDGSISINANASNTEIITFFSVAGGVGSTSLAVAYAKRKAAHGERILYLNLENFGDTSAFFSDEGNATLSDVIYAIKSKKTNLEIKLQSSLKKDSSSVMFFDSCKEVLDYNGITQDNLLTLIDGVQSINGIDKIILDIDFSLDKKNFILFKKSSSLILVDDGSELSNLKTAKLASAFGILYEQNKEYSFIGKTRIFYNKFSSRTGKKTDYFSIIGGAPKYEGFSEKQIITKLSGLEDLDKI